MSKNIPLQIPNKRVNYSPQYRNLLPGENVEFENIDSRVDKINSKGEEIISNFDLTFSNLPDNTTEVSFEKDLQCYKRMEMTDGATIDFDLQNKACNYLRVYNPSNSDIIIAIGTVSFNGVAVSYVFIPDNVITVEAGKGIEIGITSDETEADITVSSALELIDQSDDNSENPNNDDNDNDDDDSDLSSEINPIQIP